MSALPVLRAGVAIIPLDGGIQLRLGDEEILVIKTADPGPIQRLLAALDPRLRGAGAQAEFASEYQALGQQLLQELSRAGLLDSAPPDDGDEVGLYLSQARSADPQMREALRRVRLSLSGQGRGLELLGGILEEHGISTSIVGRAPSAELCDVMVCLIEQPELALFHAANAVACAAGRPCLFIDHSHGRHATVGPFYVPHDGACYRCFRQRLLENTAAFAEQSAADAYMLSTGRPLPAFGILPAHRYWVLGLAASEIVAYFAKHRPLRTLNRAITVALERAETWTEPVWRVPWCSSCGTPAGQHRT